MHRFLLSLWVIGALIYSADTFVLLNAVSFFGRAEQRRDAAPTYPSAAAVQPPSSPVARVRTGTPPVTEPRAKAEPLARGDATAAPSTVGQAERQPSVRRISESQQATRAAAADVGTREANANSSEANANSRAADARGMTGRNQSGSDGGRWGRVVSAGNVHTGPATRSQVITALHAGTRLQVLDRDHGWLKVVVPDSGVRGWIYHRFVREAQAQPSAR